MDRIPRSKHDELIALWRQQRKGFIRATHLAAQLFAHPEATDTQVLDAARGVGRAYKAVRETRASLIELHRQGRLYSMIDLTLPGE